MKNLTVEQVESMERGLREWILDVKGVLPDLRWREKHQDRIADMLHAYATLLREINGVGLDESARFFADGPEGYFLTGNHALAEHLIACAGFDRDEWTITDTSSNPMPEEKA